MNKLPNNTQKCVFVLLGACMSMWVRANECMRPRVRACVRACVRARACVCVCVCVCERSLGDVEH